MSIEAEDIREILGLLADYSATADQGRSGELAALFVEDGAMLVFGREFSGRDAIARFMDRAVRGKHISAVPKIDLDGDEATVRSDYVFFRGSDSALFSAGFYLDELVRTAEAGWRFVRREIVIELNPPD